MPQVREHKVDTVIAALAKVEELAQEWEQAALAAGRLRAARPAFRGESMDRPLLPSLYRGSSAPRNPNKDVRTQEWDLHHHFTTHAPRFLDGHVPRSGYEWLCLMQHYGVPTRLLDWTFTPLPALFFALEKYADAKPVLWMMDWTKFNSNAGLAMEFPKPHDLEQYWPPHYTDPGSDAGSLPRLPAAVLLPHSTHRVGAQSGCFVVFGTSREALQDSQTDALVKISLDPSRNAENHDYLLNLGVSDTNLYMDLVGLGSEVRRRYTRRPTRGR